MSTRFPTDVNSLCLSPKITKVNLSCCFLHRSELVAQVTCMRKSWFSSVALVGQRGALIKEQLSQWSVYHRGLKLLWKLLGDVDPLLPPAGPALCALHQLRSCGDDYQVSLYGCQYQCTVLLFMCIIICFPFMNEKSLQPIL